MKFFFLYILSLIFINCYSQKATPYRVFSIVDSMAIEDAYISMDGTIMAVTNAEGYFYLENDQDFKILQISHVSYVPFFISKKNMHKKHVFYLKPNNIELDAVTIISKTTQVILPSEQPRSRKAKYKGYKANENTIYATYIPNNYDKKSKITKIIIEVNEGYAGDPNKIYMPFRVNLYNVDTTSSFPLKPIFPTDILAFKTKESKSNLVYVNIDDFSVDFPKEGVFVSVETLTLSEYAKYGKISSQTPAFGALKKTKKSKYVTYSQIYTWNGFRDPRERILMNWGEERMQIIYNFGIEIKY